MTYKSRTIAALGVFMLACSSPALAQNTATTTSDPYATTAPVEDDDDGDEGKWGLVGLLGLAGLLGLKRRDRDDVRRSTAGNTNR